MIPKAREVRLTPKVRKVLEAWCRAPSTAQSDVKRARIVLLAAEGRSTRSIAQEVGVQPRIVSKWRWRFADHGLAGLEDRPRAHKKPIYGATTNRRILALLDKPPPQGYSPGYQSESLQFKQFRKRITRCYSFLATSAGFASTTSAFNSSNSGNCLIIICLSSFELAFSYSSI